MHVSPQRKGRPYTKRGKHLFNNRPILALVERGGSVRSFHVAVADQTTVCHIVRENVDSESHVHTDESKLYSKADGRSRAIRRSSTPLANMCAAT